MKKIIAASIVTTGLAASAPGWAQDIRVEVTNLTNGIYFTPLLIAAHNSHTHLFQLSAAASDHLQAMAEGGDIAGLSPGRVFSRVQLLERVWGYNHDGYEHTVNSHINRLRAKIESNPSTPRFVLTVWGVGYKFADGAD